MDKLETIKRPDLGSEFGGTLFYAMILTSVTATYAFLNMTEKGRYEKINEMANKHLFLSELQSNLNGALKCPAGGIKIKPGSCPGNPQGPTTSPIVLSIQDVRRMAMVGESGAGVPFSKRKVGLGARDLLVLEGLKEYSNCDIEPVPYINPSRNPKITPCIKKSEVKQNISRGLTAQVNYVRTTVLPAIEESVKNTAAKIPPVEKLITTANTKIQALQKEREDKLNPVNREIARLSGEIGQLDNQLSPQYQLYQSLSSQRANVASQYDSIARVIQSLSSQCSAELAALREAHKKARIPVPPGAQCSQYRSILNQQQTLRNLSITMTNIDRQLAPVSAQIRNLESRKNSMVSARLAQQNLKGQISTLYDSKLRPWIQSKNENEVALADLKIEIDNYGRMKEHLLDEVMNADDNLASNKQLADLGSSPSSIKILLLEGRDALAKHLKDHLVGAVSKQPDKIQTYPLLIEPVCFATPDPSGTPNKYLRRLSFKAEVDTSRVNVKEQDRIADLKRFNFASGKPRDLPVGFAPDCILSEEQDDEDKRLNASANQAMEDAIKNDKTAGPTRSQISKTIVTNKY